MYEHVKAGSKHIPPSEQPLQFQSRYFLKKQYIRHKSSHRTHVHAPNVMLPHHHMDFYIFNKF